MSNAIRYDALLVRDLAAELHAQMRGVRVDTILFDRTLLRVALVLDAPRYRDEVPSCLLWQLHPQSGHLTAIDRASAGGSPIPLRRGAAIVRIGTWPDERIVELEFDDSAATHRLIIELVTNQWNAVALNSTGRILAVLRERSTHGRVVRPAAEYVPPAPSTRAWAEAPPGRAEWAAALRAEPPGRRLGGLLRHAAYTSPLNAAAIVADADVSDDADALERARARYTAIVHDAPREPVLLSAAAHAQPYPIRLDAADRSWPTLLAAFGHAAQCAAAVPVTPTADGVLAGVAERMARLERRTRRLRAEQAGAEEEAQRLRHQADLLLSQLWRVERGAARAELDDFHGGTVVVELDPAVSATENATRLYESARKRARAASRLPVLIAAGERELTRLHEVADRIRSGTASPAELEQLARRAPARPGRVPASLPYRTYHTSNGHEVRVGRGARANDELTFHHSSPNDIWLHARDVAGAHVILRWARTDQNPPARDIAEAAVLAAVHSRARTSSTVAVDWTRRRYLRKPRKAGPGVVVPERVRTVFVEPDAAVEERLRTVEM